MAAAAELWGVAGCDPHKRTVTLCVLDAVGADGDTRVFANDPAGLQAACGWLAALELKIARVGVEGSAGWGRHVAAVLDAAGFDVREVPARRTAQARGRRRRPKTDREDAQAIAREVLADAMLPPAKLPGGQPVAQQELTVLTERRRSLVRRRQRLVNEAEGLLNKLPLELAAHLPATGGVAGRLRRIAAGVLADATYPPGMTGEMVAWLGEFAIDVAELDRRIARLEERLQTLVGACGSTLTQEFGIGVMSAAELLAEVGDPARFPSEAAFARWCGVAPVAVSSGEGQGPPTRHRLDLLGNREVNRILYTMSVTQARHLQQAQDFLARKRGEGKGPKEARRSHKRHLANRIIRRMWNDQRSKLAHRRPAHSKVA